ncbi:MAG: arylsulfatase [Verrucomicrobiales bacterium]
MPLKFLLLSFYLFACGFLAFGAAVDERPNIVLIMADDLGFSDLGCYGGEIDTPNLDALAAGGLRFSQFYNTAKCHSSRVDLLTGIYCGQAGSTALNRGVTIAEVLKPSGYSTIMSGKWHLKNEPTERGFERYFGHLSGATNFFTGDKTFRLNGKPFAVPKKGFYTTDAITDYSIRFVDEALREENKPFFLYVAYNAPHYPLQAPKEEVMKYRGKYRIGWDELRERRYRKQLALGMIPEKWALSPRPAEVSAWLELSKEKRDWEDFRMAAYAGMVDRLDQQIGRLVAHLKARGVFDKTLFMFCSDNGACPFERTRGEDKMPWDPGSYWTYDKGWAHAGNTPFRWYKQNQHEGGISSPLIVHWPAGLKAGEGSISHQPAHLIDFMATCIELAGAEYPKRSGGRVIAPLMGKSLLPVLRGQQRKGHELLYFHFGNNRAIRKGNWKVVSARGGPWELYDLEADRTELNNLATSKPELAAELSALWHEFAEKTDRLPAKQRAPVSGKQEGKKRRNAG